MKLLFDQNMSPKLVGLLTDVFPASAHVLSLGLECASDDQIWEYALHHDFVIVTKDEDYNHMSVVRGTPPKVLWMQVGNVSTAQIVVLLRARLADITAFEREATIGTLVLS